MDEVLEIVFSDRFIPHGFCFMWRPELIWMHVLADLTIALAYFSIPITIVVLVAKRKRSIPYIWVFHMFAAFIFLCSLTQGAGFISRDLTGPPRDVPMRNGCCCVQAT